MVSLPTRLGTTASPSLAMLPIKASREQGVHQVLVLAHPGPAQVGAAVLLRHKAAGGGGDAVDIQGVQQARLLHVLGQGAAPSSMARVA